MAERITVAQYKRLIEAGVLTPDDKVELLEGLIVLREPRDPPHDGTCGIIADLLNSILPDGWNYRCLSALELSDSVPEPDFALVRGDARTYTTRHPTPADTGLLVEVANTSLLRDRQDKARIYARANVVCYWIVNLEDRRVEVHTQPSGPVALPAYASVQSYGAGDSVPLLLDGVGVASIPVADLLP
jgi:hypothetical protein